MIQQLKEYMLDDSVVLFEFLELEGLLDLNTDTQMARRAPTP